MNRVFVLVVCSLSLVLLEICADSDAFDDSGILEVKQGNSFDENQRYNSGRTRRETGENNLLC